MQQRTGDIQGSSTIGGGHGFTVECPSGCGTSLLLSSHGWRLAHNEGSTAGDSSDDYPDAVTTGIRLLLSDVLLVAVVGTTLWERGVIRQICGGVCCIAASEISVRFGE